MSHTLTYGRHLPDGKILFKRDNWTITVLDLQDRVFYPGNYDFELKAGRVLSNENDVVYGHEIESITPRNIREIEVTFAGPKLSKTRKKIPTFHTEKEFATPDGLKKQVLEVYGLGGVEDLVLGTSYTITYNADFDVDEDNDTIVTIHALNAPQVFLTSH